MVKHGRDKKRRSGRTGRTQLKNRNFRRWNPKPKIADTTVQELWDAKKTPKQNLAHMGLASDLNKAHPNEATTTSVMAGDNDNVNATTKPNMIELFDVPDSDTLNTKTRRLPLNADEQEYILKGLTKYDSSKKKIGDNNNTDMMYKKMFRDRTVNPLQHTAEKLSKMGARFLLLTSGQLRVATEDIPATLLSRMPELQEAQQQQEEDEEAE